MKTFKRVALTALIVAALITGALLTRRYYQRGEGPIPEAASPRAEVPPPGWAVVPEERPSSAVERFNPFHRPTRADEVLAAWPAGSRVVHVETEKGERVELGVLPGGEIAVPEGHGHEVTVYYKPEPAASFEFRPFVGGGLSNGGPNVMAGVDVVRAWRLHAGPAVAVDFPDRDVSAVGAVGWNVWRNVDVRVAGGYGTGGGVVGVAVALAVQ
jgi:hypothetical protein